jgi:integrase
MHYVEYKIPSALGQVRQILAIPSKKTETRLVSHLTLEEVQAILDAPDPRTRLGTRDRAMLHICFAAGLRASELVGLRIDDVNLVPRPAIRILGKGRRERQLPLWKETGAALRAWLAIRGEAPVPEVFLNAAGEAMTRAGFEYVLKHHAATAKVHCPSLCTKRVFPHILRHYLPFWTMYCSGTLPLYLLDGVQGGINIVLAPFVIFYRRKGVHIEVFHRQTNSSIASAGRPSCGTYRAVCRVIARAGIYPVLDSPAGSARYVF